MERAHTEYLRHHHKDKIDRMNIPPQRDLTRYISLSTILPPALNLGRPPRRRTKTVQLLLVIALAALAVLFSALDAASPAHAQAQDGDTTTTIIDGGGGAKGYEPTNVQVVPGDRELTLSWTATSRPSVNDDKIYHAVRWSQTVGRWDNPSAPIHRYVQATGHRVDGIVLEPGVTSYNITGLKNRVVTGVHVRSFTESQLRQAAPGSSRWVRVKGKDTTPVADEVIFDQAGYSVTEGRTVSLGLSRYAINDASLDDPLTVTLDTADGSATSTDYAAIAGRSVAMAANVSTASSGVVTTSDDLVEEDETLTVSISAPDTSIFGAGNPSTATVTIQDDDRDAAKIALGNDAASTAKYAATVAEAVSGGTLNVPVTVSHLPGASTTFAVEVLSGSTAGEGSDFSIAAKSVTFGPTTAKTQNVAITLTDDGDYETDETIELRIVAADNPANDLGDHYARVAAGATAAVTLTSEDPALAPKTYALSSAETATEGENAQLTLTLAENAPSGGLAFTVSATYATPALGKAGPGDTNNLRTTTHTVAAGQSSDTITIPIAADGLVEGTETFTVAVTADDASWSVDSNRGNSATITIISKDRDAAKIAFGNDAASTAKYTATVSEAVTGGVFNLPVTVSHLPGASTTFAVEALSGSTAGEGSDFSIAAKSVSFGPATAKTQNVAVTLTDDSDYETDETIEFRIVAADATVDDLGDYYIRDAAGSTATVTVTSDESRIAFGTDPGSTTKYTDTVSEAVIGGTLNVPVTLSHLPAVSTTFAVEVLSGSTASEGSDFSIAAKSVTFGPTTAMTQIVAVTLTDDGDYETDETIELRIVAADNPVNDPGDYYTRDAGATATVTVISDELRIAFGTDPGSTTKYTARVSEAVTGGIFNLPVTVSHLPGVSTTFTVEDIFGTAWEGRDFSIAAKGVTFGPTTAKTQNVAITITNDSDYEEDETIELQIVRADHPANDPGDYYVRDAGATATVTIIASDDAATTIIDGGGGAKGYEPTNVQVVPGDRTLTVSWTVTSRPDVDDDEIWHAVRWSQTYGRYDNPGSLPDRYVDGHGIPINGFALEPGVTSYKITGLKNRVVTGVHVRSFSSGNNPAQRTQAAETSSHWVRLKGNSTTPAGDEVTFDKGDYTVAEGGTVSLGLTRYGATATSLDVPLAVTLATADGAASSSDYTAFSSRSVVIPANSAATASSVVTTSDDLVEEDETLTVSMSVPEGSVFRLGDHSTTTITVEDDDRANARIAFGSGAASTTKYIATVSEAVTGGTLNVPVTVSHLPGASTTFAVEVLSGGTAGERSDFSIAAKSLTFGPTDTSKTRNVAIALTDDSDYENDETIELRIVAADAVVDDLGDYYARDVAGSTATITVNSDDAQSAAKTYSIPSAVTVTEGGNVELTLTLGEATAEPLAFQVAATYAAGAGKAGPGDVKGFRSSSHTVAAGKSSDTISIAIPTDGLLENPETFSVSVSTDDIRWSVDSDAGNTATVTINDNDWASAKVAFGTNAGSTTKYAVTVAENTPGAYLTVPVSVNHRAVAPVTFNVEVLETSTATVRGDYLIRDKSVTFNGRWTENLQFFIYDDYDYREDVTIELRIVAADDPVDDLGDHYARDSSGATATITITSDESHFVLADKSSLNIETGYTATYTVVLTDEPTEDVTVTPVSSNDNATVSGPVTFTRSNWSVPQAITVTGAAAGGAAISHQVDSDDANFSSSKTFSINVRVTSVQATKFYEITSAVTAAEDTTAELTVTLSEAAPADMTFNVAYNYGGSTATAADTGSGRPSSVTVASGDTTATVSVPIVPDQQVESDETLKLSITPGQGVTEHWGKNAAGAQTATITIKDATIAVSVGTAEYNVGEGDGSITVPITLSSAALEDVRLAISPGSTRSATMGQDYRHPDTVTIAKGATTANFTVDILEDKIQESAETFHANLSVEAPAAGYGIGAPGGARITITDNDTAGVTVSDDSRSVMEGRSTAYTLTLDSKPTKYVIITPVSNAADKATVSDRVIFTREDWNRPKTVTITGVAPGTATISHQSDSTDSFYSSDLSIDQVQVTVTPSSVYEISSSATASEGGAAELTITLYEDAPAGGLEFTIEPAYVVGADQTAAAAADLSSPPATVSVPENQRTATVSIPIARDALVEGGETFTVTIATGATGWDKKADGADTATVTITDLTREVSLASSSYTVGESDGKVPLGLSVSGTHADTITATLTVTDGEATRNTDYGDSSATAQATFAPGETSTTLDVAILADVVAEDSETFTIAITAVSAGHAIHASDNTATVTITDDDSAELTVSPTTLSVVEYGANAYTLALGAKPTANVTVTPSSSSTIIATVSGPVTFTPDNWNDPQEITVNGVREGSSTISHAVASDDAKYADLTSDSVAVTVTAYAKTYTLTPSVTVNEGALARLYVTLGDTVLLSEGLTFEIEGTFDAPARGKAQPSDLQDGIVQGEVKVFIGNNQAELSIPIAGGDPVGEGEETFTVSIKNVHSNGAPVPEWKLKPGGTDTATITIRDSGAANAKVAFGTDATSTTEFTTSVAENVSGGTLNVPVTVSHLPVDATTFTIEVAETGTATAYADDANPGDYRIADKTVTFGPDDTGKTKNVVIAITDDDDVEAPETIALSIAAADDLYTRDTNGATATITINSDEVAEGSTKTYTITPSVAVREGQTAQLTVTLGENAPEGGVEFNVSYNNGRTTPDVLAVTAGSDRTTLEIPIGRNDAAGDDRTFTVTVTTNAPGWGVAADGTNQSKVAVADATESVKFSAGGYTVIEGSAANVVLTRTGPTEEEARVSVTVFSRGSSRGVRSYYKTTVTIPAGASAAALVIRTKDDDKVEGDGFVWITLGGPSAGYRLVGTTFVTLVIKDNDGDQQYASTYTMDGDVTAEEGGTAQLTVTLGENAHEDGLEFTVSYDYSGGSATEDDTGDTPFTLAVAAGSNTATLSVPIVRDAEVDDGETFVVSITPGPNDGDWTVAPSGSASATVTISEQAVQPNRLPTVSDGIEDVTVVTESGTQDVSLSGVFDDGDYDSLTVTAESSADTVATVSVAGDYSKLTVTAKARGTATITVTADDGNGGTVSDTFTVRVKAAPAVASAITDITGLATEVTQDVLLSGVFSDADGDSLTITATSSDDNKATVSVSGDQSKLTLTGVAEGTTAITVTAEDTDGNSVSDAFDVSVVKSADASLNALSLSAGNISPAFSVTTYAYTLAVGNSVSSTTVTARAGHGGATLRAGLSGSLSSISGGTPSGAISLSEGANEVQVEVTAEDGTTKQTYAVTVTRAAPPNRAPTVSDGIEDVTVVTESGTQDVSLSGVFDDGDYDSLTVTAESSADTVATVSVAGDYSKLTVTAKARGTVTITVTADDGNGGTVSDTFKVRVKAAPAVASAITDITGLATEVTQDVSLSGVFSDADGDSLTITAESSDDNKATVTVAADQSKLTVTGVSAGTATITVTAEDSDGNSVSDAFDVSVVKSADAGLKSLSLSAGNIWPAFSSTTYAYTLAVGNDVSSTTVTARASHRGATLKAGLSGLLSSISSGTASGAISLSEGANEVQVEVTAEDGTTKQTYAVTVTRAAPPNRAPTVSNGIEDVTIVSESGTKDVSLSGVFDDGDGDSLTITAESSDDNKATVTVAGDYSKLTVTAKARGTATITVTADDGNGGTVSDTFTVKVKAAPVVASAIDDITGLATEVTQDVLLSGVFSDADGDSLTITAESSDDNKATVSVAGDYSKLTLTGVAAGTATITVTAQDTDGNSVSDAFVVSVAASESPEDQRAEEAPGPVASLSVSVTDTADGIIVSWQPPESGGVVERYIVHAQPVKGGSGSGMTKRPKANKLSVTFSDVETGREYRVWVRAENAAGKGERVHATIELPTAPTEAPGPVVNLHLSATADSVTATWESPATGGAPTRYIAHIRPEDGEHGSGKTKYPNTKKLETTFRNLEAGKTYKVWIRGENAVGKGERIHATITLPEQDGQ